jgi:hypothetical protein
MPSVIKQLQKSVSLALLTALLTPAFANATPKPLDPGTVHVKVLKRGVGRWIAIQENNGVQIFGRIIAIGDQSVTLQLHNDPKTTEVLYTDVEYLQTGFTTGQKVFMVAGFASVAGLAAYGFVHIHNLEDKPLTLPAVQ